MHDLLTLAQIGGSGGGSAGIDPWTARQVLDVVESVKTITNVLWFALGWWMAGEFLVSRAQLAGIAR